MRKLCDLARLYVGPALDFDIQPVLRKEEVPQASLGQPRAGGSRLGWNTWLRAALMKQDAEGAVFRVVGV